MEQITYQAFVITVRVILIVSLFAMIIGGGYQFKKGVIADDDSNAAEKLGALILGAGVGFFMWILSVFIVMGAGTVCIIVFNATFGGA